MGSFTIPVGVTSVVTEAWGNGGPGAAPGGIAGFGGGGGGYSRSGPFPTSAGVVFTSLDAGPYWQIGDGSNGAAASHGNGTTGGTGVFGTVSHTGGTGFNPNGSVPDPFNSPGGGGGGGAGRNGNGNPGALVTGGGNADPYGGEGGDGGAQGASGNPGIGPGAGNGGGGDGSSLPAGPNIPGTGGGVALWNAVDWDTVTNSPKIGAVPLYSEGTFTPAPPANRRRAYSFLM